MTPYELQIMRMKSRTRPPDDIMGGIMGGTSDITRVSDPTTGPTTPNQGVIQPDMGLSKIAETAETPPPTRYPNEEFTPDFTDRDRLRALMESVPQREAPSLARSIAAAGMSIKAQDPIATADKVQYAPYHRDMADWTAKAEPFYKTATLENSQNINERTIATNASTARLASEKLAENARQADLKNEQALQRNKINLIKANMGQGWKIDAHNGTTVKMYNSATGEFKDTGIPTRWMSEEDKIDAEGQWRVDAAAASGAAAIDRIGASGTGIYQDPKTGKRYRPNPDMPNELIEMEGGPAAPVYKPGTQPSAGSGAGAKGVPSLEARRLIQDELDRRYKTDPPSKRWITKLGTGSYEVKPRPVVGATNPDTTTWGFGGKTFTAEDVQEYDAFLSEVDPAYTPPKTSGLAPTGGESQDVEVPNPRIAPSPAVTAPKEDVGLDAAKKVIGGLGDVVRGMARRPARAEDTGPRTRPVPGTARTSTTTPPEGKIKVVDKNGRIGYIQNTQEAIEAAVAQGLRVEVGN